MQKFCPPRPDELRGDHLHRMSVRAALVMCAALLSCVPIYFALPYIWRTILPVDGVGFIVLATGFGLLTMFPPLIAITFACFALFCRVESCVAPQLHVQFAPSRQIRRVIDWINIALAFLLTMAPALAACYPPVKAMQTGSIHYHFPDANIARTVDPLGFWQGVGFWFMGAGTLAFVAMIYWWPRFKQLRGRR